MAPDRCGGPNATGRRGPTRRQHGGRRACLGRAEQGAGVRLGPLTYPDYESFLPDRAPVKERKGFFLLSHLVRLYVGLDMDFDVQLVLRAAEVPACRLAANGGLGPRLGWNTWVHSGSMPRDAEDAVFEGAEIVWLGVA